MSTSFKNADLSDLPILMRLMQDFHEFDHAEPFDKAPAQKAMEKIVSDDQIGLVWLIKSSGEIVGYIVLTLHYRLEARGVCANLDEIFIQEKFRGQGIGREAMQFLDNACRSLGVMAIQLEVKKDNPEASSLYQKVGFEKLDRDFMLKQIAT